MAEVPRATISTDPAAILRSSREQAVRLATTTGVDRMRAILRKAEADLAQRLKTAHGLGGPGKDSFTAAQLQAALVQVRAVLATIVLPGMKSTALDVGQETADAAAKDAVSYMRAAERRFTGVSQPLAIHEAAVLDRASKGAESSLLHRLEGDPKHGPGILKRYGAGVVERFENVLQQRLIAKVPWDEARSRLIRESEFLQGVPGHWAERILRTESMGAHNRAAFEAMQEVHEELGDMLKILSATFDDRTACFVGSTSVTAGVVRAIFRRWYQGPALRVVTASGRDFTATPNHPVLGRLGWVRADSLQRGDYLVCDGRQQDSGTSGDQHVAARPPTLREVFDAASVSGFLERRRGRDVDFHGDGMDGDVDVLRPYRELRLGSFSPLDEPTSEQVLTPSHDVQFCTECGALLGADAGTNVVRLRRRPDGDPEGLETLSHDALTRTYTSADLFQPLSRLVAGSDLIGRNVVSMARVTLAEELHGSRLGVGSKRTSLREFFDHIPSVDLQGCSHFSAGKPGLVELDRVVHIERLTIAEHVFNLSTVDGYYTAEGVYTGNCDSYAVHGQIRRPSEAFDTWQGPVMTPPARPNDREVVVPHRMSWPLPPSLNPRTAAEVSARWAQEGRKGPHPPIPKRSTVDVSMIGKTPPPPKKAPATPPLVLTPPKELPPQVSRPTPQLFEVPPEQSAFQFGPGGISPKPFRILEPEVPPEPPKARHEVILGEQVSGQKGSNAGGVYKGADGVERYVKFYPDAAQAEMENLTNSIYRALKIDAPESEVFRTADGKVAYASKIEQGKTLKESALDQKTAAKVMNGFVADVLVGNWDAVGTGLDNVIVKKGGKPMRVDTGGSLLMRAKAGRKPDHVLNQISEWDLFFDSGKNPYYSQVAKAAGVTSARDVPHVKARIGDVVKLRSKYGDWHEFVREHAPDLNRDDAKKIGDMLEARTKLLQKKLKELKPLPKGYVPIEQRAVKAIPRNSFSIPMGYENHIEYHREYNVKHDQKLDALAAKVPNFYTAMRDYTGSDYKAIRSTQTMTEDEWKAKYGSGYKRRREQYEALDRAFAIHDEELTKRTDTPVAYAPEASVKEGFRGLHELSREALDNIIQNREFKVESVTSTSWDVEPARRFMYQSGDRYGAMLHFKYKPTSVGKLAVQKQSSVGEGEREILLREGKRFRIDSVHRAAENPKLVYIEMTEL